MSLQQLVRNRLMASREVYESQARQAMRDGHYQEAVDQFDLAQEAAREEPDERAYLKLGYVFASIASQQFIQAANALAWYLSPDPSTGTLCDPRALNRLRDVRSLYGHQEDIDRHSQAVDSLMAQNPNLVEGMALQALMAWGRGDAPGAQFLARRVATIAQNTARTVGEAAGSTEVYLRWARLQDMMQKAEELRKSADSTEGGQVGVRGPVAATQPVLQDQLVPASPMGNRPSEASKTAIPK